MGFPPPRLIPPGLSRPAHTGCVSSTQHSASRNAMSWKPLLLCDALHHVVCVAAPSSYIEVLRLPSLVQHPSRAGQVIQVIGLPCPLSCKLERGFNVQGSNLFDFMSCFPYSAPLVVHTLRSAVMLSVPLRMRALTPRASWVPCRECHRDTYMYAKLLRKCRFCPFRHTLSFQVNRAIAVRRLSLIT